MVRHGSLAAVVRRGCAHGNKNWEDIQHVTTVEDYSEAKNMGVTSGGHVELSFCLGAQCRRNMTHSANAVSCSVLSASHHACDLANSGCNTPSMAALLAP